MSSGSQSRLPAIFLGVCLVLSVIYIIVQVLNRYYYNKSQEVVESISLWYNLPLFGIIWAVVIFSFLAFLFLSSVSSGLEDIDSSISSRIESMSSSRSTSGTTTSR